MSDDFLYMHIDEDKGYVKTIKARDNIIYFIDCTCKDFEFRRIKRVGQGYDTKISAEPCKHLKPRFDQLIKEGFVMKDTTVNAGFPRLTKHLRVQLIERAGGKCEECLNADECRPLEIHRITPKTHGGLYSMDNCKVLCKEHHDQRNAYQRRNF